MQFPLLEQISIRSIHVTDRGMNFLARHSKTIKILDISGCPNITMNGIREVILECNMQWLAVNREQCSDDDRFELKSINPELCIITTEAPLAAPANSANIKGPLSY